MKRIDDIPHLASKCTGCLACVDVCPAGCISSVIGTDGFLYSKVDEAKCVGCSKCYWVCPIETCSKHNEQQRLFACYSTEPDGQNGGSSGGIFELLAKRCIQQGYCVCGAAFDKMELKHRIIRETDDIKPLLKSKYIQSNMEGIYARLVELLKNGEKIFFCGTPCQVSALVNRVPVSLRENLFTADIICHGVPSQTVFDMYIKSLEDKHDGKIVDFTFRVKDNRYKHAHGYSYTLEKNGKAGVVNGIYTNSSFYNAFKKYLIFRDSCYDCKYATQRRVSDLTLGDFWGIEKYDFKGNTDTGVSMVITNTEKGQMFFDSIRDKMVSKEFPVEYGVESNHCLTHSTNKPKNRDAIISGLTMDGYTAAAKKYFKSSPIYKIYWLIPPKVRNLLRKIRGR